MITKAPTMQTLEINDIGTAFEAVGDDNSALVQSAGGQWIIAAVQSRPFPEDAACDDLPYGALHVARFIAEVCNRYTATTDENDQ